MKRRIIFIVLAIVLVNVMLLLSVTHSYQISKKVTGIEQIVNDSMPNKMSYYLFPNELLDAFDYKDSYYYYESDRFEILSFIYFDSEKSILELEYDEELYWSVVEYVKNKMKIGKNELANVNNYRFYMNNNYSSLKGYALIALNDERHSLSFFGYQQLVGRFVVIGWGDFIQYKFGKNFDFHINEE